MQRPMSEDAPTESSNPETGEPTGASPELPDAADLSFGRTLLQFFIIPAFVVGICVGIFFFFAWLISSEKTGVEYLHEIRTGSYNRRWQAAFELSKLITYGADHRMVGLVPEMVDLFDDAQADDPRIRHYLAISLGELADPAAVDVLVKALEDDDATTRIYAAWALGKIGEPRAAAEVVRLMEDQDAGVRKMAVYSLGALGEREVVPSLIPALNDHDNDVAWNAAISLAQLGSDAGKSRLLQILDRGYLESLESMDATQQAQTLQSAIRAGSLLGDAEIRARIQHIADNDENLRIRELALKVLAEAPAPAAEEAPPLEGDLDAAQDAS